MCEGWLKEMEGFRTELENQSYQCCDKLKHNIDDDYGKMLYDKLVDSFRRIFIPNVTYKSALVQTTQTFPA